MLLLKKYGLVHLAAVWSNGMRLIAHLQQIINSDRFL